ncbi:glyceraldehyde 3-phosphate dehydrogenase, putative [Theileria annulata]|uniref:Glyceraldehyde 3-phosphate dehydrogenase, putative n=1 Tax=Theileria annulata TaxID=5874 RepID=Q4UFJ5_THEAN|nr:glyceraldehyde 3-phosphate dehydrogenase, putative [Theileria annulata]CAI74121.1 glyceraldehyde 3-phosphate dehydrogenase, putative [Theileria annulata]|eukprot:XP_951853.1 glyceraldehyde 3-phosphate dehydrogenase, putative [Theileria annulata]
MKIRIGINGYGRIGRSVHRASLERENIEIVHINDPLMTPEYIKYLLKYDTIQGKLPYELETLDNNLILNGQTVRLSFEREPDLIPWGNSSVDIVLECTGQFKSNEKASLHLKSGAKLVIISAITTDTPIYVYGINHTSYNKSVRVMSNASCTTNCLAPVVKVLHENFGIVEGLMTSVWPNMARQNIVDGTTRDFKRSGRCAITNIAPLTTPAADAIGEIIPSLKGKLKSMTFFVPTHAVAVVDLTVKLSKPTKYENIVKVIKEAADGNLKGILGYTEDEVVSSDFMHESLSSIFDINAGIALNDTFVKLISWYHNEWGYSNRLLDLSNYVYKQFNS